jgi:hypothetical protein
MAKLNLKLRKRRDLPMPIVGAIAATRGMLGFGAGLLLANRMPQKRRNPVAWTLLAIGVATTVPLASYVLRRG